MIRSSDDLISSFDDAHASCGRRDKDFGLEVELLLIRTGEVFLQGINGARLDERDDAPAEAAAGHAGAVDAADGHRLIGKEIELRHRDLIIVAQGLVALDHLLAELIVIAPAEQSGGLFGARDLADHMAASLEDRLGK